MLTSVFSKSSVPHQVRLAKSRYGIGLAASKNTYSGSKVGCQAPGKKKQGARLLCIDPEGNGGSKPECRDPDKRTNGGRLLCIDPEGVGTPRAGTSWYACQDGPQDVVTVRGCVTGHTRPSAGLAAPLLPQTWHLPACTTMPLAQPEQQSTGD